MNTVNDYNKPLSIMVTGGAGFLGSHIADALSDDGHAVTIVDIQQKKDLRVKQRMIQADILDYEKVKSAMEAIDIVFHLAAFSDLDLACDNPHDTMHINVLGTANVLEAARLNNVKKVIFASTIYVCSRTGSFYRVSKHAGELLLEAYNERYGLDYVILRFGTLYGMRSGKQNSVYRYLEEAVTTGKINFYGTGDEIREYIHVQDSVQICLRVLGDAFNGQTLILTGHHRMKASELLEMINEIMGDNLKVEYHSHQIKSHYVQTPYSYIPRVGKKIITDTYRDLGQSLVEILHEIDNNKSAEEAHISTK